MKCVQCGGELGPLELVTVPYRSLPGVVLSGLEGQRCTACGDLEYAIPGIEKLDREIAGRLVRKTERLTGHEVRFLRKLLGWSGTMFAKRMGVTPETVSRWETGATPIGEVSDRLLRMFIVHEEPVTDYSLDLFDEITDESGVELAVRLAPANEGWVAR